jgi:hypothetical protein
LFLRDIEKCLFGEAFQPIVCDAIATRRPEDYETFLQELLQRQYIVPTQAGPNLYRTNVPFTTLKGTRAHQRLNFSLLQLRQAYDMFDETVGALNQEWFQRIGTIFAAPLSLDARWRICETTNDFNFRADPPDLALQGLKINSEAQKKLEEETGNVFGNAVWLDISEKDILRLRVADDEVAPPYWKNEQSARG